MTERELKPLPGRLISHLKIIGVGLKTVKKIDTFK